MKASALPASAARLFTLLLLLGAGCAGFRTSYSGEHYIWPPQLVPGSDRLVLAICRFDVTHSFVGPDARLSRDSAYESMREVFRTSGLFSEIRSHDLGTPDLKIDVDISVETTQSRVLTQLCAMTLSLIPAWNRDRITVKTTWKDGEGKILGVILERGSVIVWVQTLLLLVAPFAWPSSIAEDEFADLSKATLLEGLKRGYLKP